MKNRVIALGDIVQIEYTNKVVGYLYKEDADEVTLCNTADVDENTPFKVISKSAITRLGSFSDYSVVVDSRPRIASPAKAEEVDEKVNNLLKFPTKNDDDSGKEIS